MFFIYMKTNKKLEKKERKFASSTNREKKKYSTMNLAGRTRRKNSYKSPAISYCIQILYCDFQMVLRINLVGYRGQTDRQDDTMTDRDDVI